MRDEFAYWCEKVLAVVEHEERRLQIQMIDHRVPDRAPRPGVDSECGSDNVVTCVRAAGCGEFGHGDAVPAVGFLLGRCERDP